MQTYINFCLSRLICIVNLTSICQLPRVCISVSVDVVWAMKCTAKEAAFVRSQKEASGFYHSGFTLCFHSMTLPAVYDKLGCYATELAFHPLEFCHKKYQTNLLQNFPAIPLDAHMVQQ